MELRLLIERLKRIKETGRPVSDGEILQALIDIAVCLDKKTTASVEPHPGRSDSGWHTIQLD